MAEEKKEYVTFLLWSRDQFIEMNIRREHVLMVRRLTERELDTDMPGEPVTHGAKSIVVTSFGKFFSFHYGDEHAVELGLEEPNGW